MYDPTVARLTYRALLGRRRAAILFVLPVLLVAIAVAVRAFAGVDDDVASGVLGGFAIATMVPLIGVIAGTGAIGPEIDDGSIVYLLAKPVKRPTIIVTKLVVAVAVTMLFSALPTLIAGLILNGNGGQIAVAYTIAALVASIAYSALFLLLGTVEAGTPWCSAWCTRWCGRRSSAAWCRGPGRSACSSGPSRSPRRSPGTAWSPRTSACRSPPSCWSASQPLPRGTRARS